MLFAHVQAFENNQFLYHVRQRSTPCSMRERRRPWMGLVGPAGPAGCKGSMKDARTVYAWHQTLIPCV